MQNSNRKLILKSVKDLNNLLPEVQVANKLMKRQITMERQVQVKQSPASELLDDHELRIHEMAQTKSLTISKQVHGITT